MLLFIAIDCGHSQWTKPIISMSWVIKI